MEKRPNQLIRSSQSLSLRVFSLIPNEKPYTGTRAEVIKWLLLTGITMGFPLCYINLLPKHIIRWIGFYGVEIDSETGFNRFGSFGGRQAAFCGHLPSELSQQQIWRLQGGLSYPADYRLQLLRVPRLRMRIPGRMAVHLTLD